MGKAFTNFGFEKPTLNGRIWPYSINSKRRRFCAWFEAYEPIIDIEVKYFSTRRAARIWLELKETKLSKINKKH